MLDLLLIGALLKTGVTAKLPIAAGHHAIQFLRQWSGTHWGRISAFSEGLPVAELQLAQRIIDAIEAKEGKPVDKIPPAVVEKYVKSIADRLQELSGQELNADPKQGKELISKLRQVR